MLVLHAPEAPNALRRSRASFVASVARTILFSVASHLHEESNVFQLESLGLEHPGVTWYPAGNLHSSGHQS